MRDGCDTAVWRKRRVTAYRTALGNTAARAREPVALGDNTALDNIRGVISVAHVRAVYLSTRHALNSLTPPTRLHPISPALHPHRQRTLPNTQKALGSPFRAFGEVFGSHL